jgi:hypothetical protein
MLRKEFSWSETRMCEKVRQFIGVNVNEFKRHGIEPCNWLNGLELPSDLKKLYWFGLAKSDLVIKKYDREVELELKTTNSIALDVLDYFLTTSFLVALLSHSMLHLLNRSSSVFVLIPNVSLTQPFDTPRSLSIFSNLHLHSLSLT